jgi:hypothetical protein
MASADDYAAWIVANKEKKGTPEFDTVAKAYAVARGQLDTIDPPMSQTKAKVELANKEQFDPSEGDFLGRGAVGGVAGVMDKVLGARQFLADTVGIGDAKALAAQAAEKKRLDAPLNTGAGAVGKFVGNLLPDMAAGGAISKAARPVMGMLPKSVGAVVNPALQGAEAGVTTPDENYSAGSQAGSGAVGGMVGDVAMRGAAGALNPSQFFGKRNIPKSVQESIAELQGMPKLIAENMTDNKFVKMLTNALSQLGPAGAGVNSARRANLGQYTSEVTGAAGTPVESLSASTSRAMRDRLDDQAAAFRNGPDVPLPNLSGNLRRTLQNEILPAAQMTNKSTNDIKAAIAAGEPTPTGVRTLPATDAITSRSIASNKAFKTDDPIKAAEARALADELEKALVATHADKGQAFTRWKAEHGVSKDIEAAGVTPSGHVRPEDFMKQLSQERQLAPRTPLERRTVAAADMMGSPSLSENRSLAVRMLLGSLPFAAVGGGAALGGVGGASAAGGSLALAHLLLGTPAGGRYLTGNTKSEVAKFLQSQELKDLLLRAGAAEGGEIGGGL